LAPQLDRLVLASLAPSLRLEVHEVRHRNAEVVGRIWMQMPELEQSRLELGTTLKLLEREMQPAEPEGPLAGPRGCWSVLPQSRSQASERD
jgi:hypothetical protein